MVYVNMGFISFKIKNLLSAHILNMQIIMLLVFVYVWIKNLFH